MIRFNNYSTDNFENDYGKKTTIWVRGSGSSDVVNRTDVSEYDAIVLEGDYCHYPIIPSGHPEALCRYIDAGKKLTNYDFELHDSLKKASGIKFPTSGLMTIWAAYSVKNELKSLDIYGFAFRNHQKENVATHYFSDRSEDEAIEKTKVHQLDKESKFILSILSD